MIINGNLPEGNDETSVSRNDTTAYGDDTIGENTGDSALDEAAEKVDNTNTSPASDTDATDPRIETVVPDEDN